MDKCIHGLDCPINKIIGTILLGLKYFHYFYNIKQRRLPNKNGTRRISP
ncbi:hypothetical protein GJA_1144 [Janthinobacterium agaricidamnosum NBRC 102515 = DSM 9628]|uniref:Uncharacterized protein n=1 Tax=Janthinobacterium agaricidamnosum NBRC 102515 = DSM 9628 TaxID=1349767 RepID=W0V366_9BURK|nr:hypothetical protein GJA_1144 [Janthinobacterium agaricidamnosum NBRC 102515 = DSM 9628]